MFKSFDIIVVGGGHAGCEAAAVAATLGSRVLLISMDLTKLAQMSCNPAMGGVGKGQILREIDAVGGFSAIVSDASSIQYRLLNRSKGPAMWSPRAQCDRMVFSETWRSLLETIPNLYLWQDKVVSLIVEDNKILGVKTQMGIEFLSQSVILTNGTFLSGLIHIGRVQFDGGRVGDESSFGITEQLEQLGFQSGRMKTGTPVRVDGRTIDYSKLTEQKGDDEPVFFSFLTQSDNSLPKRSCYLGYTSLEVHNILRTGFDDSPLFQGTIKGIGPRYCPSIEDKLFTFASKDSHQLFLEPEGATTYEMYLNGFSSSLPWEVQYTALKKVSGFEEVHILRPGYAIEYDFFPPTQLYSTLETKLVSNLYFAGQINGTTGYEEAAAQGMIAGINAHRKNQSLSSFILTRQEAYIGVMIDDLITKGVDEPYRMFTSRAEYRIFLRYDNADERLTPRGIEIGLVDSFRKASFLEKQSQVSMLKDLVLNFSLTPELINSYLEEKGTNPINQKRKAIDVLLRPNITLDGIISSESNFKSEVDKIDGLNNEVLKTVEVQLKYKGYIDRELQVADKIKRLEDLQIPSDIDYFKFQSISIEGRQKLSSIKPLNIGQASRIPGVTPSDINVLLVFLGR